MNMKKLDLTQMEQISAGGQGRTCMILGGLAFVSFFGGFYSGSGFFAAASITAGAAVYGCFD